MAGNQITLTFAGDASTLERTFQRVGDSANEMADDVGRSTREMAAQVGTSEEAFEGMARGVNRTGEALDRVSGSASMLSGGLGDVGGALTEAFGEDSGVGQFGAQLEKAGAITMFFVGAADLAILANTALSSSFVKNAAAQVASKTATIATTAATGIATAAQWAWNAAMTANPIGIIIVAVIALVAVIVLIATKTTWFQTIWEKVWGAIVAYIGWVKDNYVKAFDLIVAAGQFVVDKITAIPGLIGRAFSGLFNIITAPWRAAFNFISDAWNNTVGRLRWSIPSWVPIVGGQSISAPRLPRFHTGGQVPGPAGSEMLAIVQAGERITSASAAGASGPTEVVLRGDGTRLGDLLVEIIRPVIVRKGGLLATFGGKRG